jgi:uncharacterized damage-inducible protein DinB
MSQRQDPGTGTLARFYQGWDRYQQLLVEAISPLSAEQIAFHAAPHLRPVSTLAAHIISARARWFQLVMGEGGPEIGPLQAWDREGSPDRSAAELTEGLRTTWHLIESCLGRWTPDMLTDSFTRRDQTFTRQWIIWHVIEHDLHHGGELFFTLGMHGLPTPDL